MPRSVLAPFACALVLLLGLASPAPHAQDLTAPLVRIGGEAKGLRPIATRRVETHADDAGSILRTTVVLELRNPNARALEGTLEFPLAQGQQITGFALDIDGVLRDAVPVPKDKGRQVFESIERRRVDPGLLEQTAGNNFRLRVFPIPANGVRRVRLTVDETVAVSQDAKPRAWAARLADGQTYVVGEVPVGVPKAMARVIPKRVGLLWDASASARKRDRAKDVALLDRYFRAMGNGRVTLRLLRDVGEDGGAFEIRNGDWTSLRAKLDAAVNDGATDLADWTPRTDIDEYLLVSDGQRNYGDAELPRVNANQRLYTIATHPAGSDTVRLAVLAQQRNGRLIDASGDGLFDAGLRIVGLAPHGVTDLEVPGRYLDDGVLRVAGRATQADAFVDVTLDDGAGQRVVRIDLPTAGPSHPQVATLWATWKVRAMAVDPERNAQRIAHVGQQFGIVTAGTSLIVLENAQDYVTYDLPAPAALREDVAALRKEHDVQVAQARSERIDEVAEKFAQRIAWWERKFPKDAPKAKISADTPVPGAVAAMAAQAEEAQTSMRRDAAPAAAMAMAPPPPAPAPASINPIDVAALDSATVLTSEQISGNAGPAAATITLQPWQPDSPYARRLRAAKPDEVYTLYLDERDANDDSTAFYLDVADVLLEKGRRAEALRVLSNLAEMQLESRHVLRVLGYRLMQAKDDGRAVEVFRTVLALADEEPQSHRDLGLALAANGQRQEAITHLYEVAARPWDGRFDEVELVALNELNAIIATSPAPLDTAFVDKRLLRNLPVDLRAVLAWDSDNSDMDLWVTDPNGERCYYGNRLTFQGGQLSDDFTGGYGPEEFLLRDAKPGKYRVEANFFGDRQQVVTGATTLTLTLTTGWGSKARKDQVVTLRLKDARETVLVGEFEVK